MSSAGDENDAIHHAIAQVTGGIPTAWIVLATYLDEEGTEKIFGDTAEGQVLTTSIGLAHTAMTKYDERWRAVLRSEGRY